MIFPVLCLLARCLLDGLMVPARREASKDAELLVVRHENAILRRQISRVRYQPADRTPRHSIGMRPGQRRHRLIPPRPSART